MSALAAASARTSGLALILQSACSLVFNVEDLQDGSGGTSSSFSSTMSSATTSTGGTSSSSTTGGAGGGGTGGGASAYANAVLASSPMAYFRFDDADPVVVVDSLGIANATYSGGPNRTATGALMNDPSAAIQFDGLSQVVLPDRFEFAGLLPFSVEFWFRTDDIADFYFPLTNDSGGNPSRFGYTVVVFGDSSIGIERWNGADVIGARTPPNSIVVDTWFHFVSTFNGIEHKVYLNGLVGTTFGNSLPLVSDGLPGKIGFEFSGAIDELAFYDHEITAAEVTSHFDAR
jgi:large repetitive protein